MSCTKLSNNRYTNFYIANNTIAGNAAQGVFVGLAQGGQYQIVSNTISDNTTAGFFTTSAMDGSFIISSNTFSGNGINEILMSSSTNFGSIVTDNTITASGGAAITGSSLLEGTHNWSNNTIVSTAGPMCIHASGGTTPGDATFIINDNNITCTGGFANDIFINAAVAGNTGVTNVTISGNTITSDSGDVCCIRNFSGTQNTLISGNTFTKPTGGGNILVILTSNSGKNFADVTNNNFSGVGSANMYSVAAAAEQLCLLLEGNVSDPVAQVSTLSNAGGGLFESRSGVSVVPATIEANLEALNTGDYSVGAGITGIAIDGPCTP